MDNSNFISRSRRFVYSGEELLALKTMAKDGVRHHIPAEMKRRYRGCQAGAKLKAKLTSSCAPDRSARRRGPKHEANYGRVVESEL